MSRLRDYSAPTDAWSCLSQFSDQARCRLQKSFMKRGVVIQPAYSSAISTQIVTIDHGAAQCIVVGVTGTAIISENEFENLTIALNVYIKTELNTVKQ